MFIQFTHPHYLFLLILLPLTVMLHFFLLKIKRSDAVRFANFDALARIRGVDLYSKNVVVVSVTIMIILLIILAIAGLNIQRDVVSSAHSFVIAIDVSQSMEAVDMLPSRIEVAKKTAKEFAQIAPPGTKIAVLSYSGNSFVEQDLTEDKELIEKALDSVELSAIGGTDPADAIVSSTNILSLEDGKSIVLLSDGRINVGNMDRALDYATSNNVIIHTIGIGTEEGGQTSYGISRIEEESLQSAAYLTGGNYFRAMSEGDLNEAFNQILEYKLKKVSFDASKELLMIALILLILQYILINTRYKVFP